MLVTGSVIDRAIVPERRDQLWTLIWIAVALGVVEGAADGGAPLHLGLAGARSRVRHAQRPLFAPGADVVRLLRPPPDGAADVARDGRPAGGPLLPRLRPDLLLPARADDRGRHRGHALPRVAARARRAGGDAADRRARVPLQPRRAPDPPRRAAEDGGRRDGRRGEHRRRPRRQGVRAGGGRAAQVRRALRGGVRQERRGEPAARALRAAAVVRAADRAGRRAARRRLDGGAEHPARWAISSASTSS